jgi:hypothetical protein
MNNYTIPIILFLSRSQVSRFLITLFLLLIMRMYFINIVYAEGIDCKAFGEYKHARDLHEQGMPLDEAKMEYCNTRYSEMSKTERLVFERSNRVQLERDMKETPTERFLRLGYDDIAQMHENYEFKHRMLAKRLNNLPELPKLQNTSNLAEPSNIEELKQKEESIDLPKPLDPVPTNTPSESRIDKVLVKLAKYISFIKKGTYV